MLIIIMFAIRGRVWLLVFLLVLFSWTSLVGCCTRRNFLRRGAQP